MLIREDQLNCYIEGIKVPILELNSHYGRNQLGSATIIIPASGVIIPKMWANAFIQVTCIIEQEGTRKEKLLFQGLCVSLNVAEEVKKIQINAISAWDALNLNKTLDYVSPNEYGLKKIQDGIVLYLGTESAIFPEIQTGYKLSERYYYVDAEEDMADMGFNDPETFKLQYIANKAPFAERYARTLFENFSYENFLLSKSYMERFNLLSKSHRVNAENEIEYAFKNVIGNITSNFEMGNLTNQYLRNGSHVSGDNDLNKQDDSASSTIDISEIICHTTAGQYTDTIESVRDFHKKMGFKDIRYNWLVYQDGSVHEGIPEGKNSGSCKNSAHNRVAVSVCYASPAGVWGSNAKRLSDGLWNDPYGKWMKPEQKIGYSKKIAELMKKYNISFNKVLTHHFVDNGSKPCPCFDTQASDFQTDVKKYL